jgi:hypothetical protein
VSGTKRLPEWFLVLLGAALLAGALTFLRPPALSPDQHAYNLLVVKELDPGLFQRDLLYRYDPSLLHVPVFLKIQAALARWLGGDPRLALLWLAWPVGALYLVGHYALFRAVSGSPMAAGLAALGALTVRNSLGGEFWGFEGVRSAATRTILAGLIPLLLLLFLRWRGRPSFPAFYLVLGLSFNIHPVGAYHLAQVTALAHLWMARFSPRALIQVVAGVALFGVGTLPYALPFFAARDNVADAASRSLARAALDYRFPYLFYPISPDALLSVAFHVSLPLGVWLWWRRRGEPTRAMAGLHVVAAASVVLGFAGLALIQATGAWLDQPYSDIQQLRIIRLVYPVLLCGFALSYARLLARGTWRPRAVVAALVLASLIPPGSLIHAFSEERRAIVKSALGMRVSLPGPADPSSPAAYSALLEWTRRSTPAAALFLSDDFHFRVETYRSITGSFKDGAFLFVAGTRPFVEWYRLNREMEACRAVRGRDCWFELGRRLRVDYAIVDPALTEARAPADFEKVWERDGWSVWRYRG